MVDVAPSPAAASKKTTGATCTIACKLPNGLLAELFNMDDSAAMRVPDGQGGVRVIYPRLPYPGNEDGRLLIRGNAAQRRIETADEKGRPAQVPVLEQVATGFGLTTGVDLEWAERWFAQNAEYPPVKSGLIFMQKTVSSARDQARDHREAKNGLEPLNPGKPGDGIEPVDEKLKAA